MNQRIIDAVTQVATLRGVEMSQQEIRECIRDSERRHEYLRSQPHGAVYDWSTGTPRRWILPRGGVAQNRSRMYRTVPVEAADQMRWERKHTVWLKGHREAMNHNQAAIAGHPTMEVTCSTPT